MDRPDVIVEAVEEHDEEDEWGGDCSVEDYDSLDTRRMLGPTPLSSPKLRACWSPESLPSLEAASSSLSSSPFSLSPLSPPLIRSLVDDDDENDVDRLEHEHDEADYATSVPLSPPPPPPCLGGGIAPPYYSASSCGPPPWMCVFELDDEVDGPGQQHQQSPPVGSPPGCHQDVYSRGLVPFVIQWFATNDGPVHTNDNAGATATMAHNEAGGGELDMGKQQQNTEKGKPNTTASWRRPTATREGGEDCVGRVLRPRAATFLYAPAPSSDHHSNIETIFVPQQQVPPAADDDKRGRRPPNPVSSLTIAPSVAASIASQAAKAAGGDGGKVAASNKPPMRGGHVAADLEQVKVQTPGADRSALKDLPPLRDAPPAKREELFILKLKLCSVVFSFEDPIADKRGKDMKRQTLLELVDYVNTPAGQKIFTESVMGDLMAMVSANVCRALPPATDDFDPEEDEPVLEPAWPHLQVAYEFFLRFIVSSEVNAKAAKKYVDQKFCLQLVELFDSEDPRERDYLKTILHRIYGKFMSHRSFIRRAISNVFYRFVYETERHNGIGELLEILGSIINGFAIPLKKEHLQFLVRALIPLHKPKCVALYHQQLSYCIIQYVEKDADTATPILNGFFKCWPWSCSGKQVMFLNELEEILELLGADQLAQVSTMLFTNLARCLDSDHFQVVERALFLWNNEHLVNSGCLSRLNAQTVLPIIYGPLYKNSSGHWNATVEGLAQNVLKMYMEYDLALYDKCTAAYFREEEEAKKKMEALSEKWNAIEQMAMAKMPSLLAN